MRTTLHGANTVHERALLELRGVGDGDAHFPSIHRLFENLWRVRLAIQVQTHVITETLHLELFAVQVNVCVFADVTRRVVHALAHQSRDVFVHEGLHAELLKVWFECDASPVLAFLALGKFRFALDAHIVLEHLTISLSARTIARFDDELGGEDVRQLGAVTVAPADNLLFVVVVVARRQKMTKDEFRDVNAFVFVHFYGNAVTIVIHSNQPLLDVDVHAEFLHLWVAHLVVRRVDENFIENLVQPRHEGHLLMRQRFCRRIVHPRLLLRSLARPDVRIRTKQKAKVAARERDEQDEE